MLYTRLRKFDESYWVQLNGFFIIVPVFMYLQFSKVCEIWVLLNVTELVFHCGGDFACIFSSSGFANFVSHWVQLVLHFSANFMYFQFSKVCSTQRVFHQGADFYVSSVKQGLWILSHIENNWMGFSLWCRFLCILS